jgi:hypothetical protein
MLSVRLTVTMLCMASIAAPLTATAGDTNGALHPSDPSHHGGDVRTDVLVYMNFLDDGQEAQNVINILGAGATTQTTDPTTLANDLIGIECFVIPELYDATFPDPGQLANLDVVFSGFAPVLDTFMADGGNVIVCEGDLSASPGETVVNAIGVTSIDWMDAETSSEPMTIVEPGDCMVDGLASLTGANGWGSWIDTMGNQTEVIHDSTGDVVASRTVHGAGNFMIIGFDYHNWNTGQHDMLLSNACACPPIATPVDEGTWGRVKALYR